MDRVQSLNSQTELLNPERRKERPLWPTGAKGPITTNYNRPALPLPPSLSLSLSLFLFLRSPLLETRWYRFGPANRYLSRGRFNRPWLLPCTPGLRLNLILDHDPSFVLLLSIILSLSPLPLPRCLLVRSFVRSSLGHQTMIASEDYAEGGEESGHVPKSSNATALPRKISFAEKRPGGTGRFDSEPKIARRSRN